MKTTTDPKGIAFNEVRGNLPAWLWKGIRETERSAQDDYFPATVLKDGTASFVVVTSEDWNLILEHEWRSDR